MGNVTMSEDDFNDLVELVRKVRNCLDGQPRHIRYNAIVRVLIELTRDCDDPLATVDELAMHLPAFVCRQPEQNR